MDLFGAATKGVDPQTGTYLTKEQRVAMFRASRGMGGGSGAGANSARPGVSPQSAIVISKPKLGEIVQTLQKTYEKTAENIGEQVEENKKNIQILFTSVLDTRKAEIAAEKKETDQLEKERVNKLRRAREFVLDNLAKATSGFIRAGQAAGRKIVKPVGGFLERLRKALWLLVGAWAIDNLPAIMEKVQTFMDELPTLQEFLENDLTRVRGAWSIIDNTLKGVNKAIRFVAKKALDLGLWMGKKAATIGGKVLNTITKYLGELLEKGVKALSAWASKGIKGIADAIRPRGGGAGGARATGRTAAGSQRAALRANRPFANVALPGGDPAPKPKSIKNIFKQLTGFGKDLMDQGRNALANVGGSLSDKMSKFAGVPVRDAADRTGWIKQALGPIIDKFPALAKGIGKVGRLLGNAVRLVPGIGFAIDLALNKQVAGQTWTEAIIRALGSSIVGGVSASVGAKVGGLAGAAVGAVGDQYGAGRYEAWTGNTRTENVVAGGGIVAAVKDTLTGDASEIGTGSPPAPASGEMGTRTPDFSSKVGGSTPDGMEIKSAYGSNVTFIELPGTVTDLRKPEEPAQESSGASADVAPAYLTRDPDMDFYRIYATEKFDLLSS